jgi:hypothetical protein
MEDKEAIEMMQRCIEEIQTQRMLVERLAPKAEAYEVIRDISRAMLPRTSQGYGEDLVWRLKKKIEELQPKPKAAD